MLVNNHIYGTKVSQAPVSHLRRTPNGTMSTVYNESFTRVWASAAQLADW